MSQTQIVYLFFFFLLKVKPEIQRKIRHLFLNVQLCSLLLFLEAGIVL